VLVERYVLTIDLVIYEGIIGSRKVITVNMLTQISSHPMVPRNMLFLMMIRKIMMIQADLNMKGRWLELHFFIVCYRSDICIHYVFFLFLESRNFMEWCILCMRLLPWSWFQRHTTSCLCVLPRLCGAVHEHNHVMDHIADWEDTLIQVAAERFCHSETEWCISGIWCPHQELCRNCIL
jgi:hypothetical protein